MKSLNARLGSGLIFALLLVFSIQWALVSVIIRHVTEEYITNLMIRDVELILAGLEFNEVGKPSLVRQPEGLYNSGPYSGQYFQVFSSNHILRSESIWDHAFDVNPVNIGETVRQRLPGPVQQALLALSMGFQKQGNNITITVAEDLSAVDAGIYTFQLLYFLFSLLMMILLLFSQRWIVRSSLKPLTNTRLNLENIARGQSDRLSEDVPIEVRPLVNEINLLLNLLKRRLDRTRTAIGNLAHKLKTPMSLLSQLENDPVLDKYPQYRQRLRAQVDSMCASLERELNRARLAGNGKSGKRFVPGDDIGSLLDTLQQVYIDKNLEVSSDIQSYDNWPADQEDMLELLGTLLDNAYKWANRQIRITINDNYRIVIEDDGPGCPTEMMQSLSTRGRRLDETVNGYGLGLSVADDIVSFYKGSLKFGHSEKLGGMKITVTFPENHADF